jgi:lipopolysaccharide export system protein LptA
VLQVEDARSGEIRQATSQKAVIYPKEGKLVLMGHPVVRCSVQGLFRGDKITFFRDSERVVVENNQPGKRSQVLLSE